jgi:uncharacterized protein
MISKTAMTELVKRLAVKDVARGLDENPALLDYRDERGRNWLHLCCGIDVRKNKKLNPADSIKLATLLLDRGLGIDAPAFTEDDGRWHATPLWYAIGRGHNLKLAEFLLKRGCNPNHCLWAGVFANDLDALRLVVKYGADVDPQHEGNTPFIEAVKWSRFAAAAVLLELGANPDVQDNKGMTALHYMLGKNSDKPHFRMLMAHGVRGDIKNKKGETAKEIMSRKRDPEFREMAEQLHVLSRAKRPR